MPLPFIVRRWWRRWAASPAQSALIIVTLAVGIGLNALLFSIVRGLLLTPIALPESERLVQVWEVHRQAKEAFDTTSYPNFEDLRSRVNALAEVAAVAHWSPTWVRTDGAERLRGVAVSWNFFGVLGLRPLLGRSFQPDEDRPGHDNVVVLSERLWRRRFGGDPAILGKTLTLGTSPVQVVGVVGEFEQPFPEHEDPPEVFAPIGADSATSPRSGRSYRVVARLDPRASLEVLRVQLAELDSQLAVAHPEDQSGWSFRTATLHERAVAPVQRSLLLLQLIAVVVLLVACVNVSGVLIGRALRRRKELAIRSALGATRVQNALEILGECMALALLGGLLGTAVAVFGLKLLTGVGPALLPRSHLARLDWPILGFAFGVSLLAGALSGLLPALRTSVDAGTSLGLASGAGHRPGLLRRGLMTLEVTATLVLLVLGALTVESFRALVGRDPGIVLNQQRAYPLLLPAAWYSQTTAVAFQERLLRTIRERSVFESTGTIHVLPFSSDHSCDGYTVVQRAPVEGASPCAEYRTVSPGYLETVGTRLLGGRLLEERDRADGPQAVVINHQLARLAFPGEDPLGKRLETHERVREIVGVVSDVRHFGLEKDSPPQIYVPVGQETREVFIRQFWLVVRPGSGSVRADEEVQSIVRGLDARVSVGPGRSLDAFVDDTLARPKMRAMLVGLFALLALMIGLTGTAGLTTESVAERTHEIGVRMALGATAGRVVRQFAGECLRTVGVGSVLGAALAWPLGSVYAGRILGQPPATLMATFVGCVILLVTAGIASWLPARRAALVQPVVALGAEP